jgi:splicing factor 45
VKKSEAGAGAGISFKPIVKKEGEDAPAAKPVPVVKTTLEDWVGDDDDVNGFHSANRERQQRGGRKKRKKNKATPLSSTNWDDIYDPLRPNSYEEYYVV